MNKTNKLSIAEWAKEDRPREKMIEKGAKALSTAELLAILIGSGNTSESAVSLMQRVLADCGNSLNALAKWELHNFMSFKGLGAAKSVTIMAALELGRRRNEESPIPRTKIRSSEDIYQLFHQAMRDLQIEEFWILLINHGGRVIDKVRISQGGIDQTTADIRTILREALIQHATQIAIIHNHPSGNVLPSNDDNVITQKIKKGAETMNIRMIDHVIVSDGDYYSYNDEGKL